MRGAERVVMPPVRFILTGGLGLPALGAVRCMFRAPVVPSPFLPLAPGCWGHLPVVFDKRCCSTSNRGGRDRPRDAAGSEAQQQHRQYDLRDKSRPNSNISSNNNNSNIRTSRHRHKWQGIGGRRRDSRGQPAAEPAGGASYYVEGDTLPAPPRSSRYDHYVHAMKIVQGTSSDKGGATARLPDADDDDGLVSFIHAQQYERIDRFMRHLRAAAAESRAAAEGVGRGSSPTGRPFHHSAWAIALLALLRAAGDVSDGPLAAATGQAKTSTTASTDEFHYDRAAHYVNGHITPRPDEPPAATGNMPLTSALVAKVIDLATLGGRVDVANKLYYQFHHHYKLHRGLPATHAYTRACAITGSYEEVIRIIRWAARREEEAQKEGGAPVYQINNNHDITHNGDKEEGPLSVYIDKENMQQPTADKDNDLVRKALMGLRTGPRDGSETDSEGLLELESEQVQCAGPGGLAPSRPDLNAGGGEARIPVTTQMFISLFQAVTNAATGRGGDGLDDGASEDGSLDDLAGAEDGDHRQAALVAAAMNKYDVRRHIYYNDLSKRRHGEPSGGDASADVPWREALALYDRLRLGLPPPDSGRLTGTDAEAMTYPGVCSPRPHLAPLSSPLLFVSHLRLCCLTGCWARAARLMGYAVRGLPQALNRSETPGPGPSGGGYDTETHEALIEAGRAAHAMDPAYKHGDGTALRQALEEARRIGSAAPLGAPGGPDGNSRAKRPPATTTNADLLNNNMTSIPAAIIDVIIMALYRAGRNTEIVLLVSYLAALGPVARSGWSPDEATAHIIIKACEEVTHYTYQVLLGTNMPEHLQSPSPISSAPLSTGTAGPTAATATAAVLAASAIIWGRASVASPGLSTGPPGHAPGDAAHPLLTSGSGALSVARGPSALTPYTPGAGPDDVDIALWPTGPADLDLRMDAWRISLQLLKSLHQHHYPVTLETFYSPIRTCVAAGRWDHALRVLYLMRQTFSDDNGAGSSAMANLLDPYYHQLIVAERVAHMPYWDSPRSSDNLVTRARGPRGSRSHNNKDFDNVFDEAEYKRCMAAPPSPGDADGDASSYTSKGLLPPGARAAKRLANALLRPSASKSGGVGLGAHLARLAMARQAAAAGDVNRVRRLVRASAFPHRQGSAQTLELSGLQVGYLLLLAHSVAERQFSLECDKARQEAATGGGSKAPAPALDIVAVAAAYSRHLNCFGQELSRTATSSDFTLFDSIDNILPPALFLLSSPLAGTSTGTASSHPMGLVDASLRLCAASLLRRACIRYIERADSIIRRSVSLPNGGGFDANRPAQDAQIGDSLLVNRGLVLALLRDVDQRLLLGANGDAGEDGTPVAGQDANQQQTEVDAVQPGSLYGYRGRAVGLVPNSFRLLPGGLEALRERSSIAIQSGPYLE